MISEHFRRFPILDFGLVRTASLSFSYYLVVEHFEVLQLLYSCVMRLKHLVLTINHTCTLYYNYYYSGPGCIIS